MASFWPSRPSFLIGHFIYLFCKQLQIVHINMKEFHYFCDEYTPKTVKEIDLTH